MIAVSIFCAYALVNFYYGAVQVAPEAVWNKFFCENGPVPIRMLDRDWQFTCETYLYPFDGQHDGYVTKPDRCFRPDRTVPNPMLIYPG